MLFADIKKTDTEEKETKEDEETEEEQEPKGTYI